jgi:hypothetical protein
MLKGGIVIAASILGVLAVGCSSSSSSNDPFGSAPDFGSIQQQFKSPSGSFAGHEAKTFSGYGAQQDNGSVVSGFSFGGASTGASYGAWRLQSLGIRPQDDNTFCAIGQGQSTSCACPGGGTLEWDVSGLQQYSDAIQKGGTIDATVKIAASNCKSADGSESVDGRAFENLKGTVPAAGSATTAPTDFTIIMDAHFTAVTKEKGSVKVDIDFEVGFQNGQNTTMYSVQVDDGNVVVSGNWDSATKTGTITITDKSGTVTCVATDGKTAVCTGSGGKSATVTL